MNGNSFERPPNLNQRQRENTVFNYNDKALLHDAENKIKILNNFNVSGDIISDYNYFLEITSRNINYKKATNEPREELLKNLENILVSLIENQTEKIDTINISEAAKMFYEALPRAEISVITKLIEAYK